jgi:hypothetical protein
MFPTGGGGGKVPHGDAVRPETKQFRLQPQPELITSTASNTIRSHR